MEFSRRALAILVISLASASSAADEENPFKRAKVGDWVEYESAVGVGAGTNSGKLKVVLTAKNDREATVKQIPIDKTGKEQPAQELTIDLTKPLDIMAFFGQKGPEITKIEKLQNGKEILKVGDKEYKCHWLQLRITEKTKGVESTSDFKVWTSKDVPLYGVVKLELSQKGFAMLLEVKSIFTHAQEDKARAIIEQAVRAHGGAERLTFKTASVKYTSKLHITNERFEGVAISSAKVVLQAPDKRHEVESQAAPEGKETRTRVLNGDKAWYVVKENWTALDREGRIAQQDQLFLDLLHLGRVFPVLLDSNSHKVRLADNIKIDGQVAVGVIVTGPGFEDTTLYFNEQNGLLVKMKRTGVTGPLKVDRRPEEWFYKNFKTIDGVMVAQNIVMLAKEEKLERELIECKILEKVDQRLFEKP